MSLDYDVLADASQPFPTFSEIYAAALNALAHDVAAHRSRAALGEAGKEEGA